jgi:hypothetical protein
MKIAVFGRAHQSSVLGLVFVIACSLASFGQACNPASAGRDLNSTLSELMRVAPATDQDLSLLHLQDKTRKLTFWRRDSARKAQIVDSLRRNLQLAVPKLVRDVQNSRGSLSTTFKLYNDLSVASESLGSLVTSGSRENKAEYAALSNDLSDINRIREEISSHIEQTAASLEGTDPQLASSGGRPKKIVIDDTTLEKRSPRKQNSAQ